MSETYPVLKNIRESAGIRLAVLFGSFFILLLLVTVINSIIEKQPGNPRSHILIATMVQCILAFCIPALLVAKFSSKDYAGWLYLTNVPYLRSILGVIIVYIISLPAMEWLIQWNSNIHLPESLSSLEKVFREWETTAEASTRIILDTHGVLSVLAGVLIIGVLTGFSEELFFRGGLQGILTGTSIGKGVSIWICAFIFSVMHFQFFGFLPRLMMGAFFGYLLVWTRSLWVPVFAHVLNNSVVVISSSINEEVSISLLDGENTAIIFGNGFTVCGSFLLTILFFIFCKDSIFKARCPIFRGGEPVLKK